MKNSNNKQIYILVLIRPVSETEYSDYIFCPGRGVFKTAHKKKKKKKKKINKKRKLKQKLNRVSKLHRMVIL